MSVGHWLDEAIVSKGYLRLDYLFQYFSSVIGWSGTNGVMNTYDVQ